MVAERQRDRIEGYIRSGTEEGAEIAVGGGRPAGLAKGWYVEPTVFVNVDNKMKIAQEEIFGPVLAVIPYDWDADAVAIANDSNYGLCGSVWTNDNDRGLGIARQVRTGTYMLNTGVPIDFATPFGGYKESGVGREFGPEGLEIFLEKKSIGLPRATNPSSERRALSVERRAVRRDRPGGLSPSWWTRSVRPSGPRSPTGRPRPGRRPGTGRSRSRPRCSRCGHRRR